MTHQVKSPFPAKIKIGTVLDERCECKHLRSEHADTATYGHGACDVSGCSCRKYTWKTFIFKSRRSR